MQPRSRSLVSPGDPTTIALRGGWCSVGCFLRWGWSVAEGAQLLLALGHPGTAAGGPGHLLLYSTLIAWLEQSWALF